MREGVFFLFFCVRSVGFFLGGERECFFFGRGGERVGFYCEGGFFLGGERKVFVLERVFCFFFFGREDGGRVFFWRGGVSFGERVGFFWGREERVFFLERFFFWVWSGCFFWREEEEGVFFWESEGRVFFRGVR